MTTILNAVTSELQQKLQSRQVRGTGILVQTGNAAFLKTGSETLPLDPSVLQYFKNRDEVIFEISDAAITLSSPSQQTPQTPPGVSDAAFYIPENASSESLTSSKSPSDLRLQQMELHHFEDTSAALEFLGKNSDNQTADTIKTLLERTGSINIAVNMNSNGSVGSFVILDPDETLRMLQQLQIQLKTEALRTLPANELMKILLSNGSISLETLTTLDTLLTLSENSVTPPAGTAASVRSDILSAWLQNSLSQELTLPRTASLFPGTSPAQLLANVERLLSTLGKSGILTSVEPMELTAGTMLSEVPSRLQVFEKMVMTTGFTLENALANDNTGILETTTLKSSILAAVQQMTDFSAVLKNTVTPTISPSAVPAPVTASPSAQTPPAPADPLSTDFEHVDPAKFSLPELQRAIRTIENLVTEIVRQDIVPEGRSPASFSDATPAVKEAVPPAGQVEKAVAAVRSIVESITAQTGTMQPSGEQSSRPLLDTALRDLSLHVNNLNELITTQTVATSGLPKQSPDHAVPDSTVRILRELTRILDSLDLLGTLSASSGENRKSISDTSEPQRHIRHSDVPLATSTQPTAVSTGSESEHRFQILKQLHAAVTAFESLQLLAREQPTPDGTRQIFALPVKIGGEVNDVVVRFHSYTKKRKKGEKQSRFTADIAISPPQTGTVQTRLEYHKNASLKVAMHFEKRGTMQWFSRFQTEITSALQEHFNVPIIFTLNRASSVRKTSNTEDDVIPQTLIDLKG